VPIFLEAGPHGFPIEFYQACWDIIKQDLMRIFNDFHQNKIDLARINYGVITLLPKGAEANTIQKYGPTVASFIQNRHKNLHCQI
jgi:mannosylglycoprotein endo-beta-mannosidase